MTATSHLPSQNTQAEPGQERPCESLISGPSTRSLEALVEYIRQDASRDNSVYLLRSNTSHDGE